MKSNIALFKKAITVGALSVFLAGCASDEEAVSESDSDEQSETNFDVEFKDNHEFEEEDFSDVEEDEGVTEDVDSDVESEDVSLSEPAEPVDRVNTPVEENNDTEKPETVDKSNDAETVDFELPELPEYEDDFAVEPESEDDSMGDSDVEGGLQPETGSEDEDDGGNFSAN